LATVGITFSHFFRPDDDENRQRIDHYIEAIVEGGGSADPLWLPRAHDRGAAAAAKRAAQLDGLVISGGADLDPILYGEETMADAHSKLIVAERPPWELALIDEFLALDKPVLGICYGCQLLNVRAGGTLFQDIGLQCKNVLDHRSGKHTVSLRIHSRLAKLLREDTFEVVTSHHQAIKEPAAGASTSAVAQDGIIESIEFADARFLVGVQWHPERDRQSLASHQLFEGFLKACGGAEVWRK
jgi:putative glutamine amidotransferase